MENNHNGNSETSKYHFTDQGEPLSKDGLERYLSTRIDKFPHIRGAQLTQHGELGKTGVVVTNGHGEIIASVRSPYFIPRTLDGVQAEFGGTQCDVHVETSLERPTDFNVVQRAAKRIVEAFSEHDASVSELSEYFGAFAAGSEPEGWAIDQHGEALPIHGGELNQGCVESQLPPIAEPAEFLRVRANHILERKQTYGDDAIIVDTSVMPTSRPDMMQIAAKGNVGPYIAAMQNRLHTAFMHCNDTSARQVMDTLAHTYGYVDFSTMQQEMGTMAYWAVSASHVSIGLPHRRTGIEGMWVSETEAIAVSDMFNSDLATVAEFLMFSTPMMFNSTPAVTYNGQNYWPRDYRSVARYTIDTSYPAPFIESAENLHSNIEQSIVNGLSHTIDRASYIAYVDGQPYPCMHGRVRNRMASSEPKNQTGRVEYTGCSSSPSLYDEAARNAFLQVLTIGAYEALAHGEMPKTYYARTFPHIASWSEQKDLSIAASTIGFHYEPVNCLITESLSFLNQMQSTYPTLTRHITLARARIANLLQPPVHSLSEYVSNPRGPLSEVIQNEIQKNPENIVEVVKRIEQMQINMAHAILEIP